MNFDLENLEKHSTPLSEHARNWMFRDENMKDISVEHEDQITILTEEASQYLWEMEHKYGIVCTKKFYKNISFYDSQYSTKEEIKKYLYHLGIPFQHKVFMAIDPIFGCILTWKMLIKYAHHLFSFNDQTAWDKTLNWKIEYHHDGEFAFGKDLIKID